MEFYRELRVGYYGLGVVTRRNIIPDVNCFDFANFVVFCFFGSCGLLHFTFVSSILPGFQLRNQDGSYVKDKRSEAKQSEGMV